MYAAAVLALYERMSSRLACIWGVYLDFALCSSCKGEVHGTFHFGAASLSAEWPVRDMS